MERKEEGSSGISLVLSIEGAPDARVRWERGGVNGVDSLRVQRERRLLQQHVRGGDHEGAERR
jgi:hypothetical protein